MIEFNFLKRGKNFKPFPRIGEGIEFCQVEVSPWRELVMGSEYMVFETVISSFGEING